MLRQERNPRRSGQLEMEGAASISASEVIIRGFRLKDLRQVLRIEREVFREKAYGAWIFLGHALRDRHGFFVAEDGAGRVLGFILVRRFGGWLFRRQGGITSISVDAPFRGRGIGSRLLAQALSFLEEFGAKEITLEVHADNKPAAALYRKFGFRHKEWLPDYYGPGQAGVRMVLDKTEKSAE